MRGLERGVGAVLQAIYSGLAWVTALAGLPWWVYRGLREPGNPLERYGRVPVRIRRAADACGSLWFHAASVGEVGVLARVIPRLASLLPDLPVVVTTVTATGRERARQLLGEGTHIMYLPLDAPGLVRSAVRTLHPQLLVVAETELWPNLIREVHRYGAPILLVNGRLSEKAFRRYRLVRPGMAGVLGPVEAFCVKSERDRERFTALGASPERVCVAGDLKMEPLPGEGRDREDVRRSARLPADRRVVTAGSTREGEEPRVLEAFRAVRRAHPGTLLVLAPRYPHRGDEVEGIIRAEGLEVLRRTRQEGESVPPETDVLLLDTLGELEGVFAASEAAFVGGSLVPVGGHNLLEPAASGVPVLFGPHTEQTGGADEVLLEEGGGRRVRDAEGLARAWNELLADEGLRVRTGERARRAVREGQGALDRVTARCRRIVGMDSPGGGAHTDRGSRGPRAEDEPAGEGIR
ncbi:MAG: 3-deoxy-D-manno-octulosonic acid transferase [bacterium]